MRTARFIALLAFLVVAPVTPCRAAGVPQGVFEDCAGDDGQPRCIARLRTIAAGGFGLIVNYSQFYASADDVRADAAEAVAAGVRIIWNFSEPAFYDGTDLRAHFASLAKTCACSDNAGFIAYAVGLVRTSPATWGYYIADEAAPSDRTRVRALRDALRRLDPAHPALLIAIGDPSSAIADAHLEPLADLADVVGADYYPVGANEPIGSLARVGANVAATAARHGKRTAAVLQAFSWGQYPDQTSVCTPLPACARYPTPDEMRSMRDLVLTYERPSMILWYSFFDIMRSNNPRRHWADLRQAAFAP